MFWEGYIWVIKIKPKNQGTFWEGSLDVLKKITYREC